MSTKIIDFNIVKEKKMDEDKQIIYLHQESGMYEGLYYKDNDPDLTYRIKISFWGVDKKGDIVSLIPYLKNIYVLEELDDPEKMHFAGYYDVKNDEILDDLPDFKIQEINYYKESFKNSETQNSIIQTVQDNSGAHGVFVDAETEELSIVPVHSWRLYNNGELEPYIVKEGSLHLSPILVTGNAVIDDKHIESLFVLPNFSYYFNYETAQRVKDSIVNGGQMEISQEFFDDLTKN